MFEFSFSDKFYNLSYFIVLKKLYLFLPMNNTICFLLLFNH